MSVFIAQSFTTDCEELDQAIADLEAQKLEPDILDMLSGAASGAAAGIPGDH
ncbi:MAG: hypothetical protein AB7T49_17845 [Oligoflexales bacterium]